MGRLSKTSLRQGHEPRVVELSRGYSRVGTGVRSHGSSYDYRDKCRSRRKVLYAHSPANSPRAVPTTVSNPPVVDQNVLSLDIICQPTKSIQLGTPIDFAVMLSTKWSSFIEQSQASSIDTSNLLAAASLVAENHHGERLPMQAGLLTAPTLFDNVHPVSEDQSGLATKQQAYRTVLGSLSFPDLMIRQAGTYRIRTTLIQIGMTQESGATSLLSVDSHPIQVERQICE